jgi:Tol biopolymer transport system component
MKNLHLIAVVFAMRSLCFGQAPAAPPADEKANAVAEAKAKQNARAFENRATTINLYDRSGKIVGKAGERAIYGETVLSPDSKRIAVIKQDLANESADLFVIELYNGGTTRLTTSVKTEFVTAPVWSPDSSRIAYVTIRGGQEGIYVRAADGQGAEQLLYKHAGAFLNLSDWSADGRFLSFADQVDLAGGKLYLLPLAGGAERQPIEIFRSESRMFAPKFSPDGRFLCYVAVDKANKTQLFVRPADPAAASVAWPVAENVRGPGFWRHDGKELYYVGADRSVMMAQVSTSPGFTLSKPDVLFRPQGAVPDSISYIARDGERFLSLPPARGPQLQQLTIFDRDGKVVTKIGEPGLYSQPSFSPDAKRLAVRRTDPRNGQQDIWIIDIATGKSMKLTNDTVPRQNLLWSPDGRYVLYVTFRNFDFAVERKAADGTGGEDVLFRYTHGASLTLTDISVNGKTLVCESGGVILHIPLTGTDPLARTAVESLRDEFDNTVGRLSPDGRYLAFRSDEAQPERGEVYIRPFDTSTGMPGEAKWRISKDGAMGMLSWREDGKELFFRGLDLDSNDLRVMVVDLTTAPALHAGTPKLLFNLPGPLNGNLGNISRDGQRFVFAVNVPAIK